MDYRKNIRYFENKKILLYGGAVMLTAGLVMFFGRFGDRDSGYIIAVLAILFLLVGGFTFGITLTLRSNDKRIDDDIADALKLFEEERLEKYDLYERQLPYITSVLLCDYKYYEGSYLRRDRAGHYRTDVFVRTHLYFTEDTLYIASTEISLVRDERTDRDAVIPYKDIERAELRDRTVTYSVKGKNIEITLPDICIVCKDAEYVYRARPDLEVDTTIEDINRLADKAKGGLQ